MIVHPALASCSSYCDITVICIDVCENFDLRNIIKQPTCFVQNSKTLIDLILTNKPKCVLAKNALDTGISDVYCMVCAVLPGQILKNRPQYIQYRSYKNFSE